ncbi:MAG: hypothetical protein J3K34DRAFT_197330 [Monoraphidium minutum]|nr:MAG: hypothetical protein J3K34DRAFT_197330 [Monoraphidium minutum]
MVVIRKGRRAAAQGRRRAAACAPPLLLLLLLGACAGRAVAADAAPQGPHPYGRRAPGAPAINITGRHDAAGAAPLSREALQELAGRWRLTPQQAADIGRPEMAGRMRMCVSAYTPFIFCDRAKPQTTYSGYLIESFRMLAQRVEWLADFDDWFFDCMSWTPMIADLGNPNGTCMLAPSDIPPSDAYFRTGATLSWVTTKEGLRIMTALTNNDRSLWAPLSVFSAPLWLLIFFTSICVGFVLWAFDQRAQSLLAPPPREAGTKRRGLRRRLRALLANARRRAGTLRKPAGKPAASAAFDVEGGGKSVGGGSASGGSTGGASTDVPDASNGGGVPCEKALGAAGAAAGAAARPHRSKTLLRWLGVRKGQEHAALEDLKSSMIQSVLRLPDIGDAPSVASFPARIVLFAYGLLLLIILAIYTANSAAQLTAALVSDIGSLEDLRGVSVGVWDEYAPKMASIGIAATPLPWESTADEEHMFDLLRSGSLKALIAPSSLVAWTTASKCEFQGVGDEFAETDFGVGYHVGLSPALAANLDRHIAEMIAEGVLERLYDVNVKKQGGSCDQDLREANEMAQVTPGQVAGLWVLLGLSVALGGGVLIVYAAQRHARRVGRHAVKMLGAAAAARAGSRAGGGGGGGGGSRDSGGGGDATVGDRSGGGGGGGDDANAAGGGI